MWPHKPSLGVRCSYGVDGNGTLDIRSSLKPKFPRRRALGIRLHSIQNSYRELLEPQIPGFVGYEKSTASDFKISSPGMKTTTASREISAASTTNNKVSTEYIPSLIVNSFAIESASISSVLAFDPTYGELFTIFLAKNKRSKQQTDIAVYISSESGTILNIASIKGVDREGKFVPTFEEPIKIELPSPVKQVLTQRSAHNALLEYILVRISGKIFVLFCTLKQSKLKVSVIGEVLSSSLNDADFADVSFDFKNNSFTVIDVNGAFASWKISYNNRVTKLSKDITSSEDPLELSNWKRIIWLDNSRLLRFCRTSITEFNITDGTSRRLITADSWSRIQAVSKIGSNLFLLTLKELIWFKIGSNLERLISWKHFLDDQDPTLKLHSSGTMDTFACLIYSERHPLIFAYSLGLENGIPIILRDPYYIKKHAKGLLQQIKLYTSSDLFPQMGQYGLFEICSNLEIGLSLYSENEGSAMTSLPSLKRVHIDEDLSDMKDLNRFISNLLRIDKCEGEKQLDLIQNYARKLGEGPFKINRAVPSETHNINEIVLHFTLLDISSDMPLEVSDVSEVDHMIEQLAEFYSQKGITLTSVIGSMVYPFSKFDVDAEGSSSMTLEDLQKILREMYFFEPRMASENSPESLTVSTLLLGSSLIKAKSELITESLNSKLVSVLSNAPAEVGGLLNDWDELYEDDSTFKIIEPQSQRSQMPTIKLSQNHRKTRTPLSTQSSQFQGLQDLGKGMSPQRDSLHLLQSQSRHSSQKQKFTLSQLSSSQKKKRKKKSGFA